MFSKNMAGLHLLRKGSVEQKVGGIYDSCYNIMKENGDMEWIDLVRQVEK